MSTWYEHFVDSDAPVEKVPEKPKPFQENQLPYIERPKVFLSVRQQWFTVVATWVLAVAWAVGFCLELHPQDISSNYGLFCNIFPLLLFLCLCVPLACALIGYKPPVVAFIALLVILCSPFFFSTWGAGQQALFGFLAAVIMSWMFTAIHKGGAATDAGDGGATDYNLTYLQPMAFAVAVPLVYLWQFSIHCPLNYKLRYILAAYPYTKDTIILVVQQATGKVPKYDEKAFRTYKLNDAQYIRIETIRVMLLLALFTVCRLCEIKWCNEKEVTIDGALITWQGEKVLFPFNYTKTIPVCDW